MHVDLLDKPLYDNPEVGNLYFENNSGATPPLTEQK